MVITEADILAEIAAYWKPADEQLPDDIPVFRIAERRHKKTATMVDMIRADPHPDYDMKQVKGGNGRMIWVLRRKG
jgi:hypothetical protein